MNEQLANNLNTLSRHILATAKSDDVIDAWIAVRDACVQSRNDPSWPLHDRVEFALRDAGFDYDEASDIAIAVRYFQRARSDSYHKMLTAILEFVDRCERGEIRSKRTYTKFKEILQTLETPVEEEEYGGFDIATVSCDCRTCSPQQPMNLRFIVCTVCGNKRCPKANNHINACTGSNEPNQPGSAY